MANLSEVARLAEQDVFGTTFTGLRAETVEAANQVFADLYSDADARAPIAAALNAARVRNPREVKRFVNLYRFYAFIGQQATLHGGAPIDPDVTAKIVTLALRWPHLLNVLRTDLGRLEERARTVSDTSDTDWSEVTNVLARCAPAESGDLRRFLADGPEIAAAARVLI